MPPEILDLITKELKRRFGENPSSPEAVQTMQQIMDDTDYRNKFITQAQEGTPGGILPDWEIGGRNIHEGAKWGLSAAALAPLALSGPVGWGLGALGGLGWGVYGATEIAEAAQRQKAGLPGTGALVGGEGFGQSGWGAVDVLPLPFDLRYAAKGIRGARAATKAADAAETAGLTDLGEFRTLRTDEPYTRPTIFETVPGQGGDTIPTRTVVDTSEDAILQGRKVEQDPLKHVQETIGGEGVGALAGDEATKYAKKVSRVSRAAPTEAERLAQQKASPWVGNRASEGAGAKVHREAREAKIKANKQAAAEAAKNQEAAAVARMQRLEKEVAETEAYREAVHRRNPQYVVKEEGQWSKDSPRYGSKLEHWKDWKGPLDRPLNLPSGLTSRQDFGKHGRSPGPGLRGSPSPKPQAQSVQAAKVAAEATPDASSKNAVRMQVYEALLRAQEVRRTARGTIIKHRLDAKDAKAAKGLEDDYTRYAKAVEMLLDPKTDDKLRIVLETVLDEFDQKIQRLQDTGLKKAYQDLIETNDDLRRLKGDVKDQDDWWRVVQQVYKDMAGTGPMDAGGPSVRTPEKAWINLTGKGNQ